MQWSRVRVCGSGAKTIAPPEFNKSDALERLGEKSKKIKKEKDSKCLYIANSQTEY